MPRIVALGDSITRGVGDAPGGSPDQAGWAALAAIALGTQVVWNGACDGARARDVVGGQLTAALAAGPDVALVTAGGNDVLRGDFAAQEVERCLGQAFDRLTGAGCTVVTVSLSRIGLFDLAPRRVAQVMAHRIEEVNAAIWRAAARPGVIVVDGAQVLAPLGPRAWHIDRVHPSPRGHRALAAAAVVALTGTEVSSAVATIPPAPAPPGRLATAAWLAAKGVPWAIKRSQDLIPQVIQVIAQDMKSA